MKSRCILGSCTPVLLIQPGPLDRLKNKKVNRGSNIRQWQKETITVIVLIHKKRLTEQRISSQGRDMSTCYRINVRNDAVKLVGFQTP